MTQHPSFRRRPLAGRILGSALALVFIGALIPATGTAAVTITELQDHLRPSRRRRPEPTGPRRSRPARIPNAGSYSTFGYTTPGVDDVKTRSPTSRPGLLGNPESVPKCPEADLQAPDSARPVPRAARSAPRGSTRRPTRVAQLRRHRLQRRAARQRARAPGCRDAGAAAGTTLVSSIPFTITPRGARDYGLTGTLTDINPLPGGRVSDSGRPVVPAQRSDQQVRAQPDVLRDEHLHRTGEQLRGPDVRRTARPTRSRPPVATRRRSAPRSRSRSATAARRS